jgi:hypothetical protein
VWHQLLQAARSAGRRALLDLRIYCCCLLNLPGSRLFIMEPISKSSGSASSTQIRIPRDYSQHPFYTRFDETFPVSLQERVRVFFFFCQNSIEKIDLYKKKVSPYFTFCRMVSSCAKASSFGLLSIRCRTFLPSFLLKFFD